jgi:hypothetical protein
MHEPDEPLTAGGQARRRIAVAVSTRVPLQPSFVTDLYTWKVWTLQKTQDQMLR